jgi:hypothetical protein
MALLCRRLSLRLACHRSPVLPSTPPLPPITTLPMLSLVHTSCHRHHDTLQSQPFVLFRITSTCGYSCCTHSRRRRCCQKNAILYVFFNPVIQHISLLNTNIYIVCDVSVAAMHEQIVTAMKHTNLLKDPSKYRLFRDQNDARLE